MMPSRSTPGRRTAAGLIAGLSALLWMQAAAAADTPTGKNGATTKAKAAAKPRTVDGVPVLTRNELRACMDEQDRLQQRRLGIERQEKGLDRERVDIEALDSDLARRRSALDPTDAAGAQALADELVRRDERADEYNNRLRALRGEAQDYDSGRQSWAARCSDKPYDEMDEAAIRKERRRADAAKK